jgi:methylaspartate ammonia-lyase
MKNIYVLLGQRKQDTKQRNVVKLNNITREVSRYLSNKGRNISKLKLSNLKLTVRSHISETCIRASVILRKVTSPEII